MHERYRRQTDGRTTTYSEREREFTFAENQSWNLRKKNSLANVVGRSGEKQAGETRLQLIFNCGEWTLPTVSYQCCTIRMQSRKRYFNVNELTIITIFIHICCACAWNYTITAKRPCISHRSYMAFTGSKTTFISIFNEPSFLNKLAQLQHVLCTTTLGWYHTAAVKLL